MNVGLIFGVLALLLVVRVPVALALAGLGAFLFVAEGSTLTDISGLLAQGLNKPLLLCLPVFLVLASLLLKAGAAEDLYRAARTWLGHLPGGLGLATIVACVSFSAVSGSSVAAAATIGTHAVPDLTARGYPRPFVLGLLAAASALGIMFPPSVPLIVFGVITDTPTQSLLLASLGPGLVLLAILLLLATVYIGSRPGCRPLPRASDAERRQAAKDVLPLLSLALGMSVALYVGASPLLVAMLALAATLAYLVHKGGLARDRMIEAAESALKATGIIYLIILGAMVFRYAAALAVLPEQLAQSLHSLTVTPSMFMLVFGVILLVTGFFLEVLPMMLIFVPVLLPTLHGFDISIVWFAVFFLLVAETALIMPPFGLNLFVIQAVGKSTTEELARGALPFALIFVGGLVLLWLWPELAQGLPDALRVST